MEIKFKNKQEENFFMGCLIVMISVTMTVVMSIFYSILK